MSDFLNRISQYSPKRLALLADELRGRVEQLERARQEPIAIIGIGCRFPGGVRTPEQYWQLLCGGVDAITEVPSDRWNVDALFDPDPDAPGKMSTRWGGFIEGVDQFDPHFFGISPREAHSMDPQQRLLLEVSWEALENAGVSPQKLEGTRAAVYVGMSAADYYQILRSAGVRGFDAYTASGIAHSIASGRLSYVIGLRGPSVSLDTACSSSLVAIHHAVSSLRRGESSLAIAGGVNLILGPDITIALSKSRMMAADGRCKAFDSRADGFVRGEGCGMLVLKRLSDARADGDRIVAVIRGSAINQDGRSNGLTAPNGPSQEDVLRDALTDARLDPQQVAYVEAHGTGTALGDPIEVQALGAVLGSGRTAAKPLWIGSVKANIGHLEAAAGVAGLIKLALVLQRGTIPVQPHFAEPNPHIDWGQLGVRVPEASMPWPAQAEDAPRVGGISSFGFSGTNVHMLLAQDTGAAAASCASAPQRPMHVLTLSARGEPALFELAGAYESHLHHTAESWADVTATANAGRAHFPHRLAIVADSSAEAARQLAQYATGNRESICAGVAGSRVPKIAFLFTGQGSQYPRMARSLYESEPRFRAALEQCDELLREHLPVPLLSVLFADSGQRVDDTQYTQPALFAIEYSLATLWMSWGIRPAVLMGHSVGEVVAACVAGVLSLKDALRLIAARGRLMGALPRDGAMAAVAAGESAVRVALAPWHDRVGIAAVNGPTNVVVSGATAAVHAIAARLAEQGVKSTFLNVSHAFHSPLMRPMVGEFSKVLSELQFSSPEIDLISNVTGRPIGPEIADPAYWSEHVLAPVQFQAAIEATLRAGCEAFLEIGPHPTLLGMASQCVGSAKDAGAWLPSLRKGRDDWWQMLESLAALYVRGADVKWSAVDGSLARRRAVLPGYPFQRERYWAEAAGATVHSVSASETMLHPLLAREVLQSLSPDRLYETRIDLTRLPYLEDHRIHGELLLPSPAFMEMALAAGAQQLGTRALQLHDVSVYQPLALDPATPVTAQIVLEPPVDGMCTFRLSSLDTEEGAWRLHAGGRVGRVTHSSKAFDLREVRRRTSQTVDVGRYYEWLDSLGLRFGARFRAASQMMRTDGEVLARMRICAQIKEDLHAYLIHPAAIDACLHLIGGALAGAGVGLRSAFLLLNVESIRVHRPLPGEFWTHIRLSTTEVEDPEALESFRADMVLADDAGAVLAELEGIHLKRAPAGALLQERTSGRVRDMLHEVLWREIPQIRPLPRPSEIRAALEPAVAELAARNGLDKYSEFQTGLDTLAVCYIARTLRELGLKAVPGERFEAAGALDRLGVLERYHRLFARMLEILSEAAVLMRDGEHWRVLCALPETDPEALFADLMRRHPDCGAELSLTRRCARELASVLQGATNPMQLLFPDGSLADTEQLYERSPPARTYNGLIAKAFGTLCDGAAGRRLRILEIGAGTGSTTSYVLKQLRELQSVAIEYTFTDVSPLFLKRAREKFQAFPFFRYQLLDVGNDPAAQGLTAAAYDVIVAANVLHATPDLQRTLENVRGLLRPGGLLILLEGTAPQRFGDLTVGMLEGWWAYTDTSRRQYALMPRASWIRLLTECGFVDPVAVPGDSSGPVLSQQAVFVAQAPETAARRVARWVIIPDRLGVATAVAQALREAGDKVELLPPMDEAGSAAALASALSTPCAGVLHLGAVDLQVRDSLSIDELLEQQRRLFTSALATVQALAAVPAGSAPALWWVTRGAQATAAEESANPCQATLWGFSHVVALEYPQFACTRLDLDPAASCEDLCAALLRQLQLCGPEDQVAVRGGRHLARRLVAHSSTPWRGAAQSVAIRPDRSYLITGGLRGLGLRVAEWVAEKGARYLVLIGRADPDERAAALLQTLRGRGVQVMTSRADVGSKSDVARVLQQVAEELPPLAGVIHCAGVLDDGALSSQSWPRFAKVMGPKVCGTWLLHSLTRDLDFLVLFSSGASLAGSAGQANHAAANAFEDALAWYRQAQGKPTVSINWGPWAEIGAAADRRISVAGLQPIAPRDGLAALGLALRGQGAPAPLRASQLAVFATDWSHMAQEEVRPGGGPLFGELLETVRKNARSGSVSAGISRPEKSLQRQLREADFGRRDVLVREFVHQQSLRVLGIRRVEDLDVNEPLRELGLDSLMAMDLRNRLQSALQVPVAVADLLGGVTVEELGARLASRVSSDSASAAQTQDPAQASVASGDGADRQTAAAWEEGSL